MTAALLAGGGVGLGLILIVAGWRPASPTVAAVLAQLDATRSTPRPPSGRSGWSSWWAPHRPVGVWLARHGEHRSWPGATVRADLAVLGEDLPALCARKALWALGGFVAPVTVAALLAAAGRPLPVLLPAWASLSAAAVGFVLPDVRLRQSAAARRRSFRAAISAYLDLVGMRMASGAGLAEALRDAANVGRGAAFAQLRAALADARTDGVTPAAALGRLGEQLMLPDLVDTALRLSLVDTSGAQAQVSLQAQAASLRDRELSDTQGRANERSQSMLVAEVVLGVGFVVFLGYPAVAKVLAT